MARLLTRLIRGAVPALALILLAPAAQADTFPSKQTRIVVPYTAGGGTDTLTRLFAQKLQENWSQPVIVENRAGASGILGSETIARSAPDGYNLLMTVAAHVINPSTTLKMPYDALADFTPITLVAASPWVIVVNPDVPATNVRELIALAKANPRKLAFGSADPSSHLAGEQFKAMAGVDMLHVAYKGAAPAVTDLMGGHIQVSFVSVLTAKTYYKSGKIRVLGVAGRNRSPALPDVPTVTESGLPGYVTGAWYGLYGPAGLPAAIAEQIHAEVARIAAQPDVKERLHQLGAEPVASTPAEFAAFTREEYDKFAQIVKAAGIKPN
jgi:tripartite-type tricarboxylate transporter receptor subunit TctC